MLFTNSSVCALNVDECLDDIGQCGSTIQNIERKVIIRAIEC